MQDEIDDSDVYVEDGDTGINALASTSSGEQYGTEIKECIEFECQSCGHTDNADVNAALNIMNRFILGKYGSQYKQDNIRSFT